MKTKHKFTAALLLAIFTASPFLGMAAEKTDKKLKPYALKTCVVTDEILGDMGKPYVHEYKGREIKFCCKSCLKDFNKNPEKFVKKIEEAEAKEKVKK